MRWSELQLAAEIRPAWLNGIAVSLPGVWTDPPQATRRDGALELNFDLERMIETLAAESWLKPESPPSDWLPFSYLSFPGPMRRLAATCLYLPQRWRRHREHPSWPVAPALDVLLELAGRRTVPEWGGRWAVTLSHDVDTVHGLRRAPAVADVVERAGFRSSFFVVGDALHREPAIAHELRQRGHEIGSHDLMHDNRLFLLAQAEQRERLQRARDSIAPFGGSGFRAPSLRRTAPLIAEIGRWFDFDSSTCDSDLEQRRGCTTVLPFVLRGCLEIPVTLPTDASLMYLGLGPRAVSALWRRKCEFIRAARGIAVLVTHTEPHFTSMRRLRALEEWLGWLRDQDDVAVLPLSRVAKLVRGGTV